MIRGDIQFDLPIFEIIFSLSLSGWRRHQWYARSITDPLSRPQFLPLPLPLPLPLSTSLYLLRLKRDVCIARLFYDWMGAELEEALVCHQGWSPRLLEVWCALRWCDTLCVFCWYLWSATWSTLARSPCLTSPPSLPMTARVPPFASSCRTAHTSSLVKEERRDTTNKINYLTD